jgi:deoxyribodipyrimidine photo-lyase
MAPAEEVGLVWFRRDLRLDDNPAWAAATAQRKFVVPLYVIDPKLLASVGPYRRRQLIANLQALDYDLFEATGGRLHVRFGDPRTVVPDGIERLGATALFFNADVSSFARRRDAAVTASIDVPVESWFGSLVLPPQSVLTTKGALSKAFGAFHKTWAKTEWDLWPEASGDPVVYEDPGEPLPFLDDQAPYFEGAKEARRRLDAVLERLDAGDDPADLSAETSTELAADLRYGTISARSVVRAVGDSSPARQALVKVLARRDWYAHQLAQEPTLATEEQVAKYRSIRWRNTPAQISAWKGGFTGYPLVDAGMRELRETGRMGHAARVAAASFLVKDLLVDWRVGEKHFRHLLVDADPAQNAGNWQWVAGTGHDAAPINRVIDPVEHSRRHDPSGAYIRRWVPELAPLDDDAVHAPWTAPTEDVAAAGVRLGRDYPDPIVDHAASREMFLAAIKPGAPGAARAVPAPDPKPIELVPADPSGSADATRDDPRGEAAAAGAERRSASDAAGSDGHGDPIEPPAAAS